MVNYYRYMFKGRSHLMAPLTVLTAKTKAFKWTPECQHSFEELKKVISKEVMLSFPDYTKVFDIMPDASDHQLGAVLMQEGRPLAFFSKKLNKYQLKYTIGEKEMLGVVEALKEFRTMILGYPVR
jgi:RNase H-like domain found in reverse transcriptase